MKYAVVTGATSGIGLALARVLARKGYGIIMVSSNESNLKTACKKMTRRFPHVDIVMVRQDLSVDGAAQKLYNKITKGGYNVEVLVNNAGYGLVGGSDEIDMDRDVAMLHLNMIAPTCLCKLFIRDMYKKGHGSILNVASTGAFQPGPYTATYYASKSYIYNYSRAINIEAEKYGVNVCTLCPGTTRTQFFRKAGQKTPSWAMSAVKVAEYAIEGMEKGKSVIVPGRINRLLRLIPSPIKARGVAILKK